MFRFNVSPLTLIGGGLLRRIQMLKPMWNTIEEETRKELVGLARCQRLYDELVKAWPEELEAKYSVTSIGMNWIRAFIYLDKTAPEELTHKTVAAITKVFGPMKRDFRELDGTFYWHLEKEILDNDAEGNYSKAIYIENAHAANCIVVQRQEMTTVYEAKCE
jgi:hypothetical protein